MIAAGDGAADRVLRAEGTYDDFHRSGLSSLEAFVLQDFWGAGFFHLLAALLLAVLFGLPAAILGRRSSASAPLTPADR